MAKQTPESKRKPYTIDRSKLLDSTERKKLIRACAERRDLDMIHGRTTWPTRYMVVYLALYSGLRVSEMAALKIGDLYLKAADPYLMIWRGKGDKRRSVYIPKFLVARLRWYLRYKKQTLGEPTDEAAPLFTGRNGGHTPPITLMKSFKRAVQVAGLRPELSIHSARHTYATFLLAETGNLIHVKKQLGHENIAMTALYADILPETNGRLVNQLTDDEV